MFISHKYRFIFLRTPKTASSSLSEFFIKNIPDPNAVYTPVEDSKLKGSLDNNIIKKYKNNFKYYHFTLEDLIKENIITAEQAMNYKSIAVLRNPVDRQRSFYYFYKRWKGRTKPASLAEYKSWAPNGTFLNEPNSAIRQTDFLSLNGNVVGEYWLYENLNDKLNEFMNNMNLPIVHPLPNHKSDFRKNRSNEIQFDGEALIKMRAAFNKDFELYEALSHVSN